MCLCKCVSLCLFGIAHCVCMHMHGCNTSYMSVRARLRSYPSDYYRRMCCTSQGQDSPPRKHSCRYASVLPNGTRKNLPEPDCGPSAPPKPHASRPPTSSLPLFVFFNQTKPWGGSGKIERFYTSLGCHFTEK